MTRARWSKVTGRPVWTATRDACRCSGYYFPHRKGGGACDHSARSDFYRAVRDGVPPSEAIQYLSVNVMEKMFPL